MGEQRVLITTSYLEPEGPVDLMLRAAGLTTTFSRHNDREASGGRLVDAVGEVQAILAGNDAFTAEIIAAAPHLTVFGRCGVGYNNIDVQAATKHGVAVSYTPGANRVAVAELAIAMMLNCARHIPQNIHSVLDGRWEQRSGRELAGSTLGIVGLGSIGKSVARLGQLMGMTVLAADPAIDREFTAETGVRVGTLDEVLAASDFLSLHTYLDETTRHLIDAVALSKLKPSAYLINTARGGVVDEDALADAIERGQLAGAGIDVSEHEPLLPGSRLRSLDNVTITAHIGGATTQARARSSTTAAQQIIDFLAGGSCDNIINPDYINAKRIPSMEAFA